MRFDAGLLGTVCAWQVAGTCAEAAPLVGSGWASVPGVSSLMIWLTGCRLTDGGTRMIVGWERRQWRVMVPLRPWQLSLAPCPWLCHSVFFLLRGRHKR